MSELLAALLTSFTLTAVLAVPFINLLYRLKFQRQAEVHVLSPIFTKLHAWKAGTPNSGGVLIILVTVFLTWVFAGGSGLEGRVNVFPILLALILYGSLGLYDDIKKYFGYHQARVWGMRLRYKLALQVLFGLVLGNIIFSQLSIGGQINLAIPFWGSFLVGPEFYVPFAALTIVATANAFNITDGVDGLASGLLIMTLLSFLAISLTGAGITRGFYLSNTLPLFLAVWIGAMLAFLYFNIHPARMWMGDSGALAFGGALAVVALLLGIPLLLPVIGGVYLLETASSLLQWYSMRFMDHKLFLIAPIHHHFEAKGWPETKVTMRFWIAGALFSLVGVYFYYLLIGI